MEHVSPTSVNQKLTYIYWLYVMLAPSVLDIVTALIFV